MKVKERLRALRGRLELGLTVRNDLPEKGKFYLKPTTLSDFQM